MSHLLMLESWVGAMSVLLPRAIRAAGHEFTFVTRDLAHYRNSLAGGADAPLLGARNILTLETNEVDGLVGSLRPLHRALGFDAVISSCDYYLPAVAEVARQLGLPCAGGPGVAAACRKDRTRAILAAAGVPGPAFVVAESWPELRAAAGAMGYPLVVKPVDLCAGMLVCRVDDENELHRAVEEIQERTTNSRRQARDRRVLVEEYLDGPEFSVETVTWAGETTVVGITDKSLAGFPWFVESGHMFPADIPEEQASSLASAAGGAVAALGLAGAVAHTEVKLTASGPKVVEVNPRPAGNQITELVRRAAGIDLVQAYVQLALNERPDLGRRETGVASAAVAFLLPPREGWIRRIGGLDRLRRRPELVECTVRNEPQRAGRVESNECYLGYAVTASDRPGAAGPIARRLLDELTLDYALEVQPV